MEVSQNQNIFYGENVTIEKINKNITKNSDYEPNRYDKAPRTAGTSGTSRTL